MFPHVPWQERKLMKTSWKKPQVVEIAVGLEINSYACAGLKA